MTREDRRQWTHLGATAFAVPLAWVPLWVGWAACGVAILTWWVVLPLLRHDFGLGREGEGFVSGLRTYPVAVLAVLVAFPLPAAVAAWGVLGVGDAMSNLVGRNFGRQGFLGRTDRSALGTLAFVVTAWPAAWALAAFVGDKSAADTWLPALAAAAAYFVVSR